MNSNLPTKQLSSTERFAALSRVGTALMSELDEKRLLHLIAETACSLTNAAFAAFSLRPRDKDGQPLVPSEGHLFHLAAVVGVTTEQEALFQRMPLGGEGLLAPIFLHGVSVRVADALEHIRHTPPTNSPITDTARATALAYAHGEISSTALLSMGVPPGHPITRSFLGVPLLNRNQQVLGGLLLGHPEPGRFSPEDETLLLGLASQAAVALENARLHHSTQMRAQELDAIFESIADGVTLVNTLGEVVRENNAAHLLSQTIQTQPNSQPFLEELLHKPARLALASGQTQIETVVLTLNHNDLREYTVHASCLYQPAPPSRPVPSPSLTTPHAPSILSGAVIVWHDVTERRIREQEHFERKARAEAESKLALLQLVLDELPSSVYLVQGKDARLVLANHATTLIWGAHWPPNQPMSQFLQENNIDILGIDGQRLTPEQLATLRAVQQGTTVYQHQEGIRQPNGTTVPVLVNAVALNNQALAFSQSLTDASSLLHEEEPAAVVVHQDVTALKAAERLKDEFIGLAAHELRTPIAILKGFAQTLIVQTERGNGPALADWQLEALAGIDQATIRLVELIEDLLDVTRLQAGRLELHTEPTDMVALLQRLISRLQITTDKHQLAIHHLVPHIVACVDPRRIEQVLSNIINNAIKYSPAGGTITISIQEDSSTQMALLSIQDQGIGIPSSQQASIFGRFARADNAHAHHINGTGLGLYLCRELVERHAGRIWFESVEARGSTFYLTLPLIIDTTTFL